MVTRGAVYTLRSMAIEPSDVLPPANPRNVDARSKSQRIRAKIARGSATEEEIDWQAEYDSRKERTSRGASGSRRVSYTEEETAAVGEGDAAIVAASAAASREEGRREDNLADRGIRAMERAFARQEKLVDFMMARMQMLEDAHLGMWAQHRDSRMRETDAEIALMQAEAAAEEKEDNISSLANELLPVILKQLKSNK